MHYIVHTMTSNDKCVGNANLCWERASHEDLELYKYYVDKLLRYRCTCLCLIL